MRSFLFLLCLLHAWATQATLVSAVGYQRHCAREHVPQYEASTPGQTEGDVHCLLEGLVEAEAFGEAIAVRYFQTLNIATYSPVNHFFLATNTDRTLQTSEATLRGLFGITDIIPVHSNSLIWDYRLRGFDKCTSFNRATEDWKESPEFKTKEAETLEFRERIAATLNLPPDLYDWFNVFDAYALQRFYDAIDPEIPKLSDEDWEQTKEIADWVNARRYGSDVARNLPGSGSLGEALSRFRAKIENQALRGRPFVLHFAHYATLMSMFAAVGFDPTEAPADTIPNFLATFFFELHLTADNLYVVRMVYKDGLEADWEDITWPASVPACTGKFECPLETVAEILHVTSLNGFCTLCEDCQRFINLITDEELPPPPPSPPSPPGPPSYSECVVDFPSSLYGAVVAFVVIVGVTLTVGIIFLIYKFTQGDLQTA